MNEITKLENYNNSKKVKSKIKANTEYVIFDAQINRAIKHIRGSDILDQNIKDWYDYFKLIKKELRYNTPYQVNEKHGIEIGNVVYYYYNDYSNDEKENINPVPNMNIQSLSDSFNYQNSLTFQTLQDELRNKNEYVATLQDNLNRAYDELGKKDSFYFDKMRELQNQILELQKENERLKQEVEKERYKLEQDRKFFELEKKLEQSINKKEKEIEENNSFGLKDILENLPNITSLASLFTNKQVPVATMPTLNSTLLNNLIEKQEQLKQQEINQETQTEQLNDNVEYAKVQVI